MFVIPDFTEGMNRFFTKMAEIEAQDVQQAAPGSPPAPGPGQVFADPKFRMMMVR
jgi:hypothetical protein